MNVCTWMRITDLSARGMDAEGTPKSPPTFVRRAVVPRHRLLFDQLDQRLHVTVKLVLHSLDLTGKEDVEELIS